jgi:hypothetical protein
MTELTGQKDRIGDLQELGDPEFLAHWAAVRNRLARTPEGEAGHREIKRQYDAVTLEYRRRIDGGLAETNPDY